MDFNAFKEQRKSMAESLTKMAEKKNEKKDTNIFFPTADANGNSYAIIRLLPQKDPNKHPIQVIYKHKYTGIDGKTVSMLCPSTFGKTKDCPLCVKAAAEYNERLHSGEERPKVASYRKPTSIANVLVIKDTNNPDVNGKVMQMYIPFQLQQKIDNKLFPPTDANGVPLKEPEMIHDLWEGKNIVLSIFKNKYGYNDYSNCEFSAEKTPVATTEAGIEKIFNQLKDLLPDKSKMENPETIVEKWNSLIGMKNIKLEEEKTTAIKEDIRIKNENIEKTKEMEKTLEKEFSFAETNSTIQSDEKPSDEEELPWD